MRYFMPAVLFALGVSLAAGEDVFTPLQFNQGDFESRTGMWFRPDLGKAADLLPLKTRLWATKESVAGGAALKIVFEKDATGRLAWESDDKLLKSGSAGLSFYAKASRPLKLAVNNAEAEAGTDWKKLDFPWERLGASKEKPSFGWQLILRVTEPVQERTWLIVDRLGLEGPHFEPQPQLDRQPGPDATLNSKDLFYGAEHLEAVRARAKAQQPFKVIALGDSVTAGAQMSRGTWGVTGAAGTPFLYFSHLARLWEEHFAYRGITPVQHGHGGWTAERALTVVDTEAAGEAGPEDLVVLEFGANEMGGAGKSPAAWKADLKKLIQRVKLKTARILVLTPTTGGKIPALAEEISRTAKELADEEKVAVADVTKLCLYRGAPFAWALLANEYHPDFMGHLILAEFLAPILTGQHRNYPE